MGFTSSYLLLVLSWIVSVSFTFGDFDRAFDHDFHHFLEVRNYEEDFNDALLNLYHKQWKRETDDDNSDDGGNLNWKDSGYDEEDFKRAIEDFLDYRQQHSVAFRRNRKKSIQHRKQDTVRPYEIYDERGKLVVGKSRRRHHFIRRTSQADTAARKKRIQHFNAEERHTSPDVQQKVEDLRQSIKKKTQSTRDPSVSSNNEDAIKEAHNKDTSSSVDTNNVLVLQALEADDVAKSSVQHRINNDQVAHVNILRITADPLLDEGQSKPIIGDDEKIVQVKDNSDADDRLDTSLNSIVDKIAESVRDDSKFVNHRTSQRVLNDRDSIGDRNPVNDNNVQVASVVIDDTVDEESKKVAKLDPDTIFLETKTSTTVPSKQNITTQIAGPVHAHRKAPPDQITTDKKDKQGIDRISFIAIIAACCVAGVAGLGLAGYCWYKLRQETAEINDSPRSSSRGRPGSKGSNKGSTKGMVEDEKMAQGAEVFHYLHAKKQMNQMEPPGPKRDVVQDASDTDEDEEDTVYECPGLAPPGDMRVVNPLFSDAESHHSAGDVRSDSGSGSDPTQAHNDGIPRPPPYNRPPS